MRLLVTPYIASLMAEGKPFALDYDRCKIYVDEPFEAQNNRWIYGAVKNDNYCMYIPKSLAVWIPMAVAQSGYGAVRDFIRDMGVELGA